MCGEVIVISNAVNVEYIIIFEEQGKIVLKRDLELVNGNYILGFKRVLSCLLTSGIICAESVY